jgi:hypothetical protein
MSFLSAYNGVTRVVISKDGDKEYWVDLKKYLTQGGQETAEAAMNRVEVVNGKPVVRPDVAKYRKLMVFAAIDDWNMDDDNGQTWPINLQNVGRLPLPIFNQLWVQIQTNNSESERSKDEQLDFRE